MPAEGPVPGEPDGCCCTDDCCDDPSYKRPEFECACLGLGDCVCDENWWVECVCGCICRCDV